VIWLMGSTSCYEYCAGSWLRADRRLLAASGVWLRLTK
jgi:hypothetical protein